MTTTKTQSGVTLSGFIVVVALVLVIALVAFRTIPSYIEYYTVTKAVEGAIADSKNLTPQEIKRNFDRRIAADYVDSVRTSDLEVSKEGNQVVATVSWQKKLPLVANVSLLLDFEAQARR
jgi:Tfp pilus assembly protein PilE